MLILDVFEFFSMLCVQVGGASFGASWSLKELPHF